MFMQQMAPIEKRTGSWAIGVDIESIDRFRILTRDSHHRLLDKIYTEAEQDYCFSRAHAAQHLADRFSAKEAVIKCYGHLNRKAPFYHEIEIINDARGVPMAHVNDEVSIKVSLAHCQDRAIAFAVLEVLP
jgi:holo-[acyl-carrier protein] synthase